MIDVPMSLWNLHIFHPTSPHDELPLHKRKGNVHLCMHNKIKKKDVENYLNESWKQD